MIARKSVIVMITSAMSGLLGLIGMTVIARLWGDFAPEALGVIGFGMAFVGMFSFISNLGFDVTHIKRVSEEKDIGTCNGTYITIKLILVTAMALTVIGSILFMKYVLNQGFYDSTKEIVIYIFLGYYVLLGLAQIPLVTFNATREIAKKQTSTLMDPLIRVPLVIIIALAGVTGAIVGDSMDPITIPSKYIWPSFLQSIQVFIANHTLGIFAMAYLLGMAVLFIVAFVNFRGYPIKRPTKEYGKSYLNFAVPTMISISLASISINVDKVMIGFFWSANEVGHFFAAQRIIQILLMVSGAIGVVLFPTISSLHAKKQFKEIKKTTYEAERYISMLTIPLVVIVIIFSSEIINLILNQSFEPAINTLRILSIFVLLTVLYMPFNHIVVGMDRPGLSAKIATIGCVINIVMNYLLIPDNGLLSKYDIVGPNGAAIATVLSALTMLILYRIVSKRMIKTRLFQPSVIIHIIAGVAMGLILYLISTYIDPIHWYHLAILAASGLGVYIFILWTLKEFNKDDYQMIINAINPKGMFQYLKSELRLKKGPFQKDK